MSVRSAGDAFGHGAVPDTSSLDRSAFAVEPPAVRRLALATASPEVRHDAVRQRRPRGPLAVSLVALLQARALDEALDVAQALLDTVPHDDPQRPSVERTIAVAVGRDRLPARWGADPVADWLRARLLDATGEGASWLGVLSWLGRNTERWAGSAEALEAMPLAAAALVTHDGPARALSTVSATLRRARRIKDGAGLVRVLVLRAALAGVFLPEALHKIVPSPRRGGAPVAEAWKPLLLARRALADAGHVVGTAHLTAALIATDVRRGIMGDLRLLGRQARIPSWGSRSLDEKEAGELHAIVHGREPAEAAPATRLPSAPWPAEWGGPDTRAVSTALWRLIAGGQGLVREVFLHDGLALAAVHALGGHAMNALSALGASRTPPALDEARTALARAIHGGLDAATLPADLPSKQADAVYRQLRELPEPSLALDTPYGLLGAQRAEAQHALQASGRLQEFRKLRLVLERPDVAEALAPFWVLGNEAGLERPLVDLVRVTFAQLAPPTPDECRLFLRSLE